MQAFTIDKTRQFPDSFVSLLHQKPQQTGNTPRKSHEKRKHKSIPPSGSVLSEAGCLLQWASEKKAQISFRMLPSVSRRMLALDNFHALNPSNFIESEHNTQLPVHIVGGQQFPSTWRATLNSHHRILATLRFRSTTTDKQS